MSPPNDDAVPAPARGQRWLSETQAELGLGIVASFDERQVTISYPAVGEERTYARRNAPLWRALFGVGDRIRTTGGPDLTVTAVAEQAGLATYSALDADGAEHSVAETDLDPHLQLNRPQQRLLAGRIDRDVWFLLRRETREQRAAMARSPVRGLVGPRISPIPHQLYIAAEVADRAAPRVLLADEVGLGKTIEAGLILHRMLLTGRADRVLILVPEPLLHQWLVELLRRFNLRVALLDEEALAAAADGANPFEAEQRVLCSLDLLTASAPAGKAALAAHWDMLIVDEAHHLHWTPEETGADYALVETLAARAGAVLLLTGTPEQLGRAGHFGRLRLLDPHRFGDYAAFLTEDAGYAEIAEIASELLAERPPGPENQARLDALLGDTAALTAAQIVERLLDRHGTGRLLFRNTRSAISGFPERVVHPYPLPAPNAGSAAGAADASDLLEAADPRVPWLIDLLRRLHPAKVLLITARPETVLALRRVLQERAGIHAAVFHEGMEIVERDRAAAYFADPEEGTRILLCSEIGSEGRNFQFAHHLVLLDLPPEPGLLEQRIGRLDRIGQLSSIHIHVPYIAGSAGEVLYRWHAEGLSALAASAPAAGAVYEQLGERLAAALADPPLADALIADAAALRDKLNAELQAGRDCLLELSSNRPAVSEALVDAVYAADRGPELFSYLSRYWDAFGVEHEPGPGGSTVLHPGRHMLQERFPGLPDDGLTVSFDRGHSLAHEDRAFLTWEHPMVREAMALLDGSDLGSAAVLLTRDPRFRAGALLLEMLYVSECPAPASLQVERFLPGLGLRLLLDESGRDHAAGTPADGLHGKCLTGNRKLASAVITAKGAAIEAMLAHGEAAAQQSRAALERDARERMTAELDAEIERLRALARVNPSIRADEIEMLAGHRERLSSALGRVRMRLDALRLVVHA